MAPARVNRLAALIGGIVFLISGVSLLRLSRFAAPKGAVLIAVGVLLLCIAAWPKTVRRK